MFRVTRVNDRFYRVYDDEYDDGTVGVWSNPELAQEQCDQLNVEFGVKAGE